MKDKLRELAEAMTKMLEDLAEVVDYLTNYPDTSLNGVLIAGKCYVLIKYHHAEIAQNAESAKRLAALEQAMEEEVRCIDHMRVEERADEIMWERSTPEQPE